MHALKHPFHDYFPLTTFSALSNFGEPPRFFRATLHAVDHKQYFTYKPNTRLHIVAYTLVLSGHAVLSGGPEHGRAIGPGDIIRLDGRTGFQVKPQQVWEECSVLMNARNLQALNALGLLNNPAIYCPSGNKTLVQAYSDLIDCLNSNGDNYANQLGLIRWATVLQRHLDQHIPNASITEKIQRWLLIHLQNRPTISEAAAYLGISESHLRRVFRSETGQSIGNWQIDQRVKRAQILLHDHSIDEVSDALGYSDRFAFSRQFKQHTGSSPGQWLDQTKR